MAIDGGETDTAGRMKMRVSPLAGANDGGCVRRTLERANARGPDRPHPAARGAPLGRWHSPVFGWNGIPLLVHHVLGRIVDFDRLERSGAHMQHDLGTRDAARSRCARAVPA